MNSLRDPRRTPCLHIIHNDQRHGKATAPLFFQIIFLLMRSYLLAYADLRRIIFALDTKVMMVYNSFWKQKEA